MKKIWTVFLAIVLLAVAACSTGRQPAEAEAVRSVVSVSFRQLDDTTLFFVRLYWRTPFDDMQEMYPVMSGQSDFTTSCMLYFDQQVVFSIDDK